MKVQGACDHCGKPSILAMKYSVGGNWWTKLRAPVRRACNDHVSDLMARLRIEVRGS